MQTVALLDGVEHRGNDQKVEDHDQRRGNDAVQAEIDECQQPWRDDEIADEIIGMVAVVGLQRRAHDVHGDEPVQSEQSEEEHDDRADCVGHVQAADANRLKWKANDDEALERHGHDQPGGHVREQVLNVEAHAALERSAQLRMVVEGHFEHEEKAAGVHHADVHDGQQAQVEVRRESSTCPPEHDRRREKITNETEEQKSHEDDQRRPLLRTLHAEVRFRRAVRRAKRGNEGIVRHVQRFVVRGVDISDECFDVFAGGRTEHSLGTTGIVHGEAVNLEVGRSRQGQW